MNTTFLYTLTLSCDRPSSSASNEICEAVCLPVDRNPDDHACSKRAFCEIEKVDLPLSDIITIKQY